MNGSSSAAPSLTEGSIVGPLLRLSGPFVIGHALNLVFLVVNRLWVGRVGTQALAALGTATSALMVIVTFAMGMAVGTLAGVARHIGARQPAEAARYVAHGLYIAIAYGLLCLGAAFFVPRVVLGAMHADAAVFGPAAAYLGIGMGGLLVQAPLIVTLFALQGAGEGRAALLVGGVAAVLNTALDPLFIFGFDLGMPGAAWATIVSNAVGLVIGVRTLRATEQRLWRAEAFRPAWDVARRIIGIGVPGSLEHVVRTVAGFLLVTLLTPFGAHVVSAYTAGVALQMVLIFPGLALGQATAALVGQNLGAGQPDRAWRTAWVSTGLYTAFMVVVGALVFAAAPALIAVFDHDPAVVAEGTRLLRITVLCFPLVAVALVLSRAFGGAGATLPAMTAAAIAHLFVQIPLVWFLSHRFGTSGAYAGMAIAFTIHGLLAAALFIRGFRRVA